MEPPLNYLTATIKDIVIAMGCISGRPRRVDLRTTIKAALLIQRWYRRYKARMEMRRKYTWTIFQSIEYANQQDQLQLYNFFHALMTHIPDEVLNKGRPSAASVSDSLETASFRSSEYDFSEVPESHFQRLPLNFPLQKSDVSDLIGLFVKKNFKCLHPKYVASILHEASLHLRGCPNLNVVSMTISKQVTICGDLHGKLDDLLVVLHKNGLPSLENPYVFNGDFVDRGKKGLEVFVLLLTCFIALPGSVFLNRGNHEDTVMNGRYGFIREIDQKYKQNSDKLMPLIEEVYRWLPLGTVVDNQVVIFHGGISNETNIDILKNLDRSKYVSILRPPLGSLTSDRDEWKQIFDILWSDPRSSEGCEPNTLRGAGTYFGPDVSTDFLERNNYKYLVRSHECKPDGYEFEHNDQVITIFSASNYYAVGSNKGAYLKLNPQMDTYFVQYTSSVSKASKLTFRQQVSNIESSALRELGAQLRRNRDDLEQEFRRSDPAGKGVVTVNEWCDAMESATKLGLPWRLLRDKLAPSDEEIALRNEVQYFATLELLDADIIIATHDASTSVADSLYKNKSNLQTLFHLLDKDNSGHISMEEFGEAIDLIQKHLNEQRTREELLETCKLMDINKDGLVDLNEFLEAFRLCDQSISGRARKSERKNGSASYSRSSTSDEKRRLTVKAFGNAVIEEDNDGDTIDPTDHEAQTLTPISKHKKLP